MRNTVKNATDIWTKPYDADAPSVPIACTSIDGMEVETYRWTLCDKNSMITWSVYGKKLRKSDVG